MDRPRIPAEVEELRLQDQRLADKVMEVAREAMEVLREDLPAFVEREVRRVFVEAPEFGEAMGDEELRSLKERIRQEGRKRAEEILGRIADPAIWLEGLSCVGRGTSFEDNPRLWTEVDAISRVPERIMAEWKFPVPKDGFNCRYRQPTWFIAGRHMKTLAEHYWARLAELAEVRARLAELSIEERRTRLRKRWDSL